MSNGASNYEIDPSRIRMSGDEAFEAIALSAEINETGVHIAARTGSVSTREIELPYEDIDSVGAEEGLLYALVLEADGTRYALTNVAANESQIQEIIGDVRTAIEEANSPSVNGQQPEPDGATETDSADAPTSDADELQKWVELHEQGVISDEELEQKKRELL